MKTVLVTGAAGFTGRFLCATLQRKGCKVHGLVNRQPSGMLPLDEFHRADIRDSSALGAIIESVRPSAVVHLAGVAFVGHSDVDEMYATNVVATRNLLQVLAKSAFVPDMVLLASSANVYGNNRAGVLNENVPPNPANDYAVSKLAMEFVASLYKDSLPIVVTRPFNYIGIGQSTKFVISKIVEHVKKHADLIRLGNLDVSRDFSDVRDVAEYYSILLDTPDAVGKTVNLCSGRSTSLREMISMIEKQGGHKLNVHVDPLLVRDNEVPTITGDPSLLRRLTHTDQPRPIEDTIAWMLRN